MALADDRTKYKSAPIPIPMNDLGASFKKNLQNSAMNDWLRNETPEFDRDANTNVSNIKSTPWNDILLLFGVNVLVPDDGDMRACLEPDRQATGCRKRGNSNLRYPEVFWKLHWLLIWFRDAREGLWHVKAPRWVDGREIRPYNTQRSQTNEGENLKADDKINYFGLDWDNLMIKRKLVYIQKKDW